MNPRLSTAALVCAGFVLTWGCASGESDVGGVGAVSGSGGEDSGVGGLGVSGVGGGGTSATGGTGATNGWYSCGGTGFSGSDPSGINKRECGLPNPDPGACTAAPGQCCGKCGGKSGSCYCDTDCVLLGDCCPDACSTCGAC